MTLLWNSRGLWGREQLPIAGETIAALSAGRFRGKQHRSGLRHVPAYRPEQPPCAARPVRELLVGDCVRKPIDVASMPDDIQRLARIQADPLPRFASCSPAATVCDRLKPACNQR